MSDIFIIGEVVRSRLVRLVALLQPQSCCAIFSAMLWSLKARCRMQLPSWPNQLLSDPPQPLPPGQILPDSASYRASSLAPTLNQLHCISQAQILHARRKVEIRDHQAPDLLHSRQRSPQEQLVSLFRGPAHQQRTEWRNPHYCSAARSSRLIWRAVERSRGNGSPAMT
jgi:hypothetical protein